MVCTRESKCCLEKPRQPGVETPGCCRTLLTAMLKDLTQIFNQSGLRYWLDWGSLLGLIRNQQLISYDRDLDFGFFDENLDQLHSLAPQLQALGYVYCAKRCVGYRGNVETAHPRIFCSPTNKLFADIFLWRQDQKYKTTYNMVRHASTATRKNRCPMVFYDNLEEIDFEGVKIKVPHTPTKYLELRYGPNWQQPEPFFYQRGGHRIRLQQLSKIL